MRKGSAQIWPDRDTNVNSPTISARYVIAIIVPTMNRSINSHIFNEIRATGIHTVENCVWDGQQVCLESVESEGFERQCQILRWRRHWYLEGQAEYIERPQIVVLQALPQKLRRHRLAVMHATLARVFPQHSVDDDFFFSVDLSEPVEKHGSHSVYEGTYFSVNQPFFPLNQLEVAQGPAGISKNEKTPITSVSRP